jgi:hypothetical protein
MRIIHIAGGACQACAAWNYFHRSSVDRWRYGAFIARFQTRYGPQRLPSDLTEAAYFGVRFGAETVDTADSDPSRPGCNPSAPVRLAVRFSFR